MSATVRQRLAEAAAADDAHLPGLLKAALERLPAGALPLGRTGPEGGRIDDHGITVTVRRWARAGTGVHAELGVFYQEVIGGCSCGDDPVVLPACALLALELDAAGGAHFTLLSSD